MKKSEIIILILLAIGFLGYCLAAWIPATSDQLQISALDIGQGDAIYIRTPAGTDILIDGGPDRKVLSELGSVMPPYDHRLELVIATHPDMDHIAGLTELPDYYEIDTLIVSGATKQTVFSRVLEQWPQVYGINKISAYQGWRLELEPDLWLEFLHPAPPVFHEDPNDDSVVFVLHYKEFSALFTGDAPTEIEEEIIEDYPEYGVADLDVDLLKIGHHGSRTSTSQMLLNVTTPSVALISVGVDNKFNHPHAGPLFMLKQAGIPVFRTDKSGRIKCTSDGYTFTCQ